jgi:hypothetical protein
MTLMTSGESIERSPHEYASWARTLFFQMRPELLIRAMNANFIALTSFFALMLTFMIFEPAYQQAVADCINGSLIKRLRLGLLGLCLVYILYSSYYLHDVVLITTLGSPYGKDTDHPDEVEYLLEAYRTHHAHGHGHDHHSAHLTSIQDEEKSEQELEAELADAIFGDDSDGSSSAASSTSSESDSDNPTRSECAAERRERRERRRTRRKEERARAAGSASGTRLIMHRPFREVGRMHHMYRMMDVRRHQISALQATRRLKCAETDHERTRSRLADADARCASLRAALDEANSRLRDGGLAPTSVRREQRTSVATTMNRSNDVRAVADAVVAPAGGGSGEREDV